MKKAFSLLPALPILLVCLFCFTGCDLKENPAKVLPPFDRIQSNGSVTFKLVTGVENKVISTNISEMMYSVSSGQLNVNASGGTMTIAIKDLKLLWCNACSIENPEPLIADTLGMYVHAGSVNLDGIQINGYLKLDAINTGTYEFKGYAHFFNVSTINLATIKAFDMVTDSTYVSTTSITDTEVNATQVINVVIMSSGNVRYKGNPPIVRLTKIGSGQLIKE